jgi:hypothetical protein
MWYWLKKETVLEHREHIIWLFYLIKHRNISKVICRRFNPSPPSGTFLLLPLQVPTRGVQRRGSSPIPAAQPTPNPPLPTRIAAIAVPVPPSCWVFQVRACHHPLTSLDPHWPPRFLDVRNHLDLPLWSSTGGNRIWYFVTPRKSAAGLT